jgi:hypothetical protein
MRQGKDPKLQEKSYMHKFNMLSKIDHRAIRDICKHEAIVPLLRNRFLTGKASAAAEQVIMSAV